MLKDICTNCPYRDRCKRPCTKVKDYIDQDYVGSKEFINSDGDVSDMYNNIVEEEWPELVENIYLTPREKEILTLLGRGLTRADVCQVLDITRNTLRWHIFTLNKKIRKT